MLEVETFLPLDYLQAKPLKQRLRDIREPKQVKLVYDVLKFEPPEIEKAVLFATNNALVCETPEDAMKVAYEIDRSRYDVNIWNVCWKFSNVFIIFVWNRHWHWTEHFIRNPVSSLVVAMIWRAKPNDGTRNIWLNWNRKKRNWPKIWKSWWKSRARAVNWQRLKVKSR